MPELPIVIKPLPLTAEEIARLHNINPVTATLDQVRDMLGAVSAAPLEGDASEIQAWVTKYADAFLTRVKALLEPPFQVMEVFDLLGTLIEAARELPLKGESKHAVVSALAKYLIGAFVRPKLGFFAFLVDDKVIDGLIRYVFGGRSGA